MKDPKPTILVVEDDLGLQGVLVDHLNADRFYNVVTASDGEEAVVQILDHKPAIILLDLLLPKLDGFKVLERIRKSPDTDVASAKVIVLSNLWSNKDILRARALHIEEYFVKANTNLPDVIKKVKQLTQGS